ncbi:WAT1-related protein At5g07050-like [Momordica charantia]|uniref:WAT1-related protein At5g07050-like n=1 Tax=Momordica charantia TaxID=3673 RepID=A0A6J1DM67_MOMCH|nr:WAT1-related protein At5g07050-like [Momordica charantia]
MEGKGNGIANFVEGAQPYIAMISLQFGYAGMNIITKVALNRGMSHYVLVTYRQTFATVALAPFAFFLERKVRPKITFPLFMQILLLGLLGPVIDQNFYYAGLKLTSPTFSCAMSNMLPAMTFILALLCRMEKLEMKKVKCQAKVVGTMVTVGGAILMTLYKGNVISFFWSHHYLHSSASMESTYQDWVKGSILLLFANLAWASFFIFQAMTLKKYTAHLSLTTLVCFLGTLQSMAVTFVMENNKSSVWTIGWDMNLLAAVYAGIVSSSIAYYVQGMIMQKRGPVFVTAFTPMIMIIVAIMGSFMLAEKIYIGRVVGGVLMVVGLYSVLWGKYRDYKDQKEAVLEEAAIVEPVKLIICEAKVGKKLATVVEEEEEEEEEKPTSSSLNDIEMQRNDTTSIVGISVSILPSPPPPIIVIAMQKAPPKA